MRICLDYYSDLKHFIILCLLWIHITIIHEIFSDVFSRITAKTFLDQFQAEEIHQVVKIFKKINLVIYKVSHNSLNHLLNNKMHLFFYSLWCRKWYFHSTTRKFLFLFYLILYLCSDLFFVEFSYVIHSILTNIRQTMKNLIYAI